MNAILLCWIALVANPDHCNGPYLVTARAMTLEETSHAIYLLDIGESGDDYVDYLTMVCRAEHPGLDPNIQGQAAESLNIPPGLHQDNIDDLSDEWEKQ